MPKTHFEDPYRGTYEIPRTQKATGVLTLRDEGWNIPPLQLVQHKSEIENRWKYLQRYTERGAIFARPCPVRPRHGFVDSGIVKSIAEAEAMFDKATEADPDAEMLLMQAIKADWSAIWVPGRIVIGPGHDGATSGHNSFGISLATGNEPPYIRSLSNRARVIPPEVPYIEIVQSNATYNPFYVQVRGGPAMGVGNGTDYIPHSMAVEHVVEASGDLMEWEAQAKTFEPGTAVWHPGGSMLSHYAVHSVLNHIPILISHMPRIGEKLEPTLQKPPVNMDSVRRGIGAATVLGLNTILTNRRGEEYPASRRNAVAAMLTGLHNLTAFTGNDGFWLGAGAVIMQRLGAVALVGEARHAGNRRGQNREQIYIEGLGSPFHTRRKLHRAQWLFRNYGWRGGYGGKAWANCGEALLGLDTSIREFVQSSDQTNYTKLGGALNQAVNQAHNGGWWLNKFCEEELMNQAAVGDPRAVVAGIGVLGTLANTDSNAIETAIGMWDVSRPLHTAVFIEHIPEAPARAASVPNTVQTAYEQYIAAKHSLGNAPMPAPPKMSLSNKFTLKSTNLASYGVNCETIPILLQNAVAAQVKHFMYHGSEGIHIQYKTQSQVVSPGKGDDYATVNIALTPELEAAHKVECTFPTIKACLEGLPYQKSWADGGTSTTPYYPLFISKGTGHQVRLSACGFTLGSVG